MAQFALDTFTTAKVLGVNKRNETHGNELVPAMDIKWKITASMVDIDQWFPGVLDVMFVHKDTKSLPGVSDAKTKLRPGLELLEAPFKLPGKDYTGYIITIDRGREDPQSQFSLDGTDVDTFKVDPKEGGSADLFFTTKTSGLKADLMGLICSVDGSAVKITATPPKLQQGTLPDKAPKSKKDKATQELPLDGAPATSPFKYTVKDGVAIDNSTGKPVEPQPEKDATGAFLSAHAQPPEEKQPEKTKPAAKEPATSKAPLAKKIAGATSK